MAASLPLQQSLSSLSSHSRSRDSISTSAESTYNTLEEFPWPNHSNVLSKAPEFVLTLCRSIIEKESLSEDETRMAHQLYSGQIPSIAKWWWLPMLAAIGKGSVETVTQLINAGADTEKSLAWDEIPYSLRGIPFDGATLWAPALIPAIACGKIDIIRVLWEKRKNAGIESSNIYPNPLLICVEELRGEARTQVLDFLLSQGVTFSDTVESTTALFTALGSTNTELWDSLLAAGARLDGPPGKAALCHTARKTNSEDATQFLKVLAATAGSFMWEEYGPKVLEELVPSGNSSAVTKCIEAIQRHLTMNESSDQWRDGKLGLLGSSGLKAALGKIISNSTPDAIRPVYHALFQKLVDAGADVNETRFEPYNTTLLWEAMEHGNAELVEYLLDSKFSFNVGQHDNAGRTLLHCRGLYKKPLLFDSLGSLPPDLVDTKDNNGMLPLHFAARYGTSKIVQLLERKTNESIDTEDFLGRTPLAHALEYNKDKQGQERQQKVKILLERGAALVGCHISLLRSISGARNGQYISVFTRSPPFKATLTDVHDHPDARASEPATRTLSPETPTTKELQIPGPKARDVGPAQPVEKIEPFQRFLDESVKGEITLGSGALLISTFDCLPKKQKTPESTSQHSEEEKGQTVKASLTSEKQKDALERKSLTFEKLEEMGREGPHGFGRYTSLSWFLWTADQEQLPCSKLSELNNMALRVGRFLDFYCTFAYYHIPDLKHNKLNKFAVEEDKIQFAWSMLLSSRAAETDTDQTTESTPDTEQTTSDNEVTHEPRVAAEAKREEVAETKVFYGNINISEFPGSGLEYFLLAMRELNQKWKDLLTKAEAHLEIWHAETIERSGSRKETIQALLDDNKTWLELDQCYDEHLRRVWAFIDIITSHPKEPDLFCERSVNLGDIYQVLEPAVDRGIAPNLDALRKRMGNRTDGGKQERTKGAPENQVPEATGELEIGRRIQELGERTEKLIQLEFSLVSIREAQKGTTIAESMARLSWITFIFLPAMFVASLFGMNIDLLRDNPRWIWAFIWISVTFVLVLLGERASALKRWLSKLPGLSNESGGKERYTTNWNLPNTTSLNVPALHRMGAHWRRGTKQFDPEGNTESLNSYHKG